MKLIPIPKHHLRQDKQLPFGLRDSGGQLLLAGGQSVESVQQFELLSAQDLYADEAESADWHRRVQAAMDLMIRQGATLSQVAAAQPKETIKDHRPAPEQSLHEQWDELSTQLDSLLRDLRADTEWPLRMAQLCERARALLQRRPDAALYLGLYEAAHSTHKYSSRHSLLVMQLCDLAAPLLKWPQPWVEALCLAALSMNVGMHRLQDQLALTDLPLTPGQRAEVDEHAEISARLLRDVGVADALWLEIVRLHHDSRGADLALTSLTPPRQLARLLRRVDIFTAKLSRRVTRVPMSPVQAAREACLGVGGVPDEIGGALLKAVGLYPPGSFVELASGEQGIVVARGRRANLPVVASLVGASGNVLLDPPVRDTTEGRYAVKLALPTDFIKVRPPHERLIALR